MQVQTQQGTLLSNRETRNEKVEKWVFNVSLLLNFNKEIELKKATKKTRPIFTIAEKHCLAHDAQRRIF